MILGDAHARDTRSTGLVGMNAWSNAIADDDQHDVSKLLTTLLTWTLLKGEEYYSYLLTVRVTWT